MRRATTKADPTAARAATREPETPAFWVRYMNLLQPRLGAEVESASDEFFGSRHRLIQPEAPVWKEGVYDEHGKWMDGWETRRRRDGGHDWCVLKLGLRGIVRGIDIDTSFFDGNQPVAATVESWDGAGSPPPDARWRPLVLETPLGPSRLHRVAVEAALPSTHLRLQIHPDGGVARLRAYGEVVYDWSRLDRDARCDLAAAEHGGQAIVASDQHFGSMHHLLLPGPGRDMGDGWETRRRRGPGHDWVVVRLGHPGVVERVVLDTAHFKGNYPDRASLQAARIEGAEPGARALAAASASWPLLLPESKLAADSAHAWSEELAALGPVSHVRLNIYPDGGVSRLRLLGRLADPEERLAAAQPPRPRKGGRR